MQLASIARDFDLDRLLKEMGYGSKKKHSFHPRKQPRLFADVLPRRALAYLIDAAIIAGLTALLNGLFFILGIFTFGLTWLLSGLSFAFVAILYSTFTISGPWSGTYGMKHMGLMLRTWHNSVPGRMQAALHAALFYGLLTIMGPFLFLFFLVPWFNSRKRCIHDFLVGTVLIKRKPRKSVKRSRSN